MGYNTYNTLDLVNNVKLIGHVPTGNKTFTDDKIVTLADRELQLPLMKQILSTRGGYYLTYKDYPIDPSGLYGIPSDCIAGTIVNAEIVNGTSITPINLIEESEQFSTTTAMASSYGCFLKGNFLQVLPVPSTGVVRLWFYKRPSRLIETTAAGQVTAISGAIVTVSSLPSTIQVGCTVDLLGDQPPFNILATQTILSITNTDITLDAPVTGLSAGDWIALEDQSPVPQIPVEFRPLLEQRVVVKIYELQGYLDKMKAAKAQLDELEKDAMSLITTRIKSKTKIIMPSNGGFTSGNRRFSNFPAGANS